MSLLQERSINAELERNIANAQVRNMQAQMHPHFLFNALNTINQTAILEGSTETPKLIRALSGIMRRTLDSVSYTHLDVYKRQLLRNPHL